MFNRARANSSSTQPGVGTRIRGVFETAHGIGENIRGRTLGAIDNLSKSGPPESKSHYSSIADRGRMETETGMAHIYGYPDPNATNGPHNGPTRLPQSNTGNFGSGHTTGTGPGTGYMRTGGDDYDTLRRGGGVDGGVGRDDGYGQPGVQNVEHQQATLDGKRRMSPDPSGSSGLSPQRGPQDAGFPTQQRMKGGPPPNLPPRPQAPVADNDQNTQLHQ